MSVPQFSSIVERLQRSANVRTVYGDPIETDGKAVVPVARVAFGFGGGFGTSHGGEESGGEESGGEESGGEESSGEESSGDSEGGGLGGGAIATPVGALEITDDRTRFVRFEPRRRSAALLVVGLVVGLLVGRRTGLQSHER